MQQPGQPLGVVPGVQLDKGRDQMDQRVGAQARAGFRQLQVGVEVGVHALARGVVGVWQGQQQFGRGVEPFAVGEMLRHLEPRLQHFGVARSQPGGAVPGLVGGRVVQFIGQALGALNAGLGLRLVVRQGGGSGRYQIGGGIERLHRHQGRHQQGPAQQTAEVGHVVHALATQPLLQQLVGHVHRQHRRLRHHQRHQRHCGCQRRHLHRHRYLYRRRW
ncbi:hypothetical protein D9M68_714310 [compost metagenome]